jgi:multidrug efflux pump subunit AcrB
VATLTSGLVVGNFFQAQSIFDVVVQGVAAVRTSPESVRNLIIDKPGGGTVRLRDVAAVSVAPDPTDIRHDAVSRYVDVTARAEDPGALRSTVANRLENLPFPLGYHAEVVTGSANGPTLERFRSNETSHSRFLIFVLAAEVAVLLLLQAAFGSWAQAFVVFLTLPLAALGGVIVALVTGHASSLGAMAGVLAVVGLAVRPAIGLVTRVHQLGRHEEEAVSRTQLTLRAARERFAPTLTAAVTTALVVLPFVVLGRTPGNEITQPLAEVILGGLVTATLYNLFLAPAIGLAFGVAREEAAATASAGAASAPTGAPDAQRRTSDATP